MQLDVQAHTHDTSWSVSSNAQQLYNQWRQQLPRDTTFGVGECHPLRGGTILQVSRRNNRIPLNTRVASMYSARPQRAQQVQTSLHGATVHIRNPLWVVQSFGFGCNRCTMQRAFTAASSEKKRQRQRQRQRESDRQTDRERERERERERGSETALLYNSCHCTVPHMASTIM